MEVKPGYKLTEAGLVPIDWIEYSVGDLIAFEGGSQPDKSVFRSSWKPGYVRLIQIRDYKSDRFETYVPSHLARRFCTDEDIMIGRYGPPVFQILRGLTGAYNVALIKALPLVQIDRNYAYYYLKRDELFGFVEKLSQRSSGQTGVDLKELRAFPLPLPPNRKEQEAIAEALSDVDGLIESIEQLIAKKRRLKQAAMQELLSGEKRLPGFDGKWHTYQFAELFTMLRNASNSRSELKDNGEVAYVHYGDIHSHPTAFLYPFARHTYISRKKVLNIPRLADGDLLMADASEDTTAIGKAVEITGLEGREAVAGLHTMVLRGDKNLLADGFKGYVQFLPKVRAALVRLATGVSVYGITKSGVKAIEITIPMLGEQSEIARILSGMDAELAALDAKLSKARKFKQGMMQELLTGRTRLI